jgi:ParB family chromosome partitioning protein
MTIQRCPKNRARRWQLPPVQQMSVGSGELDAGDDEREGEGAALAERSDHKPRTPRQPKEANDAPAIIIQGRRGIVLSGQVTVRFDGEAAPQTFDF